MAERLRLFFALWPQPDTRDRLAALAGAMRKQCGGKATRPENLHLTLVFLGEVEATRLAEIEAAAAGVRAPAFELRLCRPGYWQHNRIAWVAPADPPRALFDLVSALQDALVMRGFARESRPYVPHLTLLRHARCRGEDWPAVDIAWPVAEFVLVASVAQENGRAYQALGRWTLGTE